MSRIIGELEARLGLTLLLRTTRRIALTDAGALFLDRAREILAEIEDAEDAARGLDSLRGTIRLAMPVVYGTRKIIPRLPKFLAAHPLLRVELSVADERQDLVAEGADVAIRARPTSTTPCFGARKLVTLQRMLVASPGYLAVRGTPKTPADLAVARLHLRARQFRPRQLDVHPQRHGRCRSTCVAVSTTSSGPGAFASVMAGLGIAMVSTVMAGAEVESGLLVPLLRGYKLPSVDVHALFPGGPRPSAKVRALVDFLVAELKG